MPVSSSLLAITAAAAFRAVSREPPPAESSWLSNNSQSFPPQRSRKTSHSERSMPNGSWASERRPSSASAASARVTRNARPAPEGTARKSFGFGSGRTCPGKPEAVGDERRRKVGSCPSETLGTPACSDDRRQQGRGADPAEHCENGGQSAFIPDPQRPLEWIHRLDGPEPPERHSRGNAHPGPPPRSAARPRGRGDVRVIRLREQRHRRGRGKPSSSPSTILRS